MRVLLLPQARKDLDGISDPLLSRILRRIDVLKRFPELGAPMGGPFQAYRSMVVFLFRVVYRILPDDIIEVAYVRDCRRRPAS